MKRSAIEMGLLAVLGLEVGLGFVIFLVGLSQHSSFLMLVGAGVSVLHLVQSYMVSYLVKPECDELEGDEVAAGSDEDDSEDDQPPPSNQAQ